jgi:hypothetical protein
MSVHVLDASGTQVNLSTTTDGAGNLVGSTAITDPISGAKQTVAQLHNADQQNLSGASTYGALGSDTPMLIDPVTGLADRQHMAGAENMPSTGLAAFVQMTLTEMPVNSGTGTVAAIGPATITPVSMSGSLANPAGGPGWSIKVGTTIFYDVGGANQEEVKVTAVTGTTFTATFSKTHSAAVPMLVRCYYEARQAAGQPGVQSVSTEGHRSTYRYCVLAFAPLANPTDILLIQGSATMTVRIKKIKITGQATAQGSMPVQIIRRTGSGLSLGGAVLTAITPAKHSSADSAATATVSTVGTANITTLGVNAGLVGVDRLNLSPLGTGPSGSAAVWEFSTRNDKPVKLSGTNEYLCLNFNGAAVPAGGVIDIEIEAEEDWG